MKFSTPEISWHERDPIYTIAFHSTRQNVVATAGVTGVIRIWEIQHDSIEKMSARFLANLKRHNKGVNALRWSPDGKILASGGDEGVLLLWNENDIKNQKTLDNDEDENLENWFAFKTLRGHLEDVLDICWSKDNLTLISGSIDNSAIVWDVASGSKLAILKEPKGFVQGVAFDPLNQFYAVLSTDRPCMYIPHDKPSIAISVCPIKFKNFEKAPCDSNNLFVLPYRLVFAIITENSVYFYDTQHLTPFAYLTGIHYSNLTDLSWSNDGLILCVASIDGFCTFVKFGDSELGEKYNDDQNSIDMIETKVDTVNKASNAFNKTPVNKPVPVKSTIPTLFSSKSKKTITMTKIE